MGLSPGYRSRCKDDYHKIADMRVNVVQDAIVYDNLQKQINELRDNANKNPNPKNFRILNAYQYNTPKSKNYILVSVKYEGCTNYEGQKILVYECNRFCRDLSEFFKLKSLDPHFCDGDHFGPIARFVPTKDGWQMAITFIKAMLYGVQSL